MVYKGCSQFLAPAYQNYLFPSLELQFVPSSALLCFLLSGWSRMYNQRIFTYRRSRKNVRKSAWPRSCVDGVGTLYRAARSRDCWVKCPQRLGANWRERRFYQAGYNSAKKRRKRLSNAIGSLSRNEQKISPLGTRKTRLRSYSSQRLAEASG